MIEFLNLREKIMQKISILRFQHFSFAVMALLVGFTANAFAAQVGGQMLPPLNISNPAHTCAGPSLMLWDGHNNIYCLPGAGSPGVDGNITTSYNLLIQSELKLTANSQISISRAALDPTAVDPSNTKCQNGGNVYLQPSTVYGQTGETLRCCPPGQVVITAPTGDNNPCGTLPGHFGS